MYQIAHYLGELNKKEEVKANRKNECGYAKVVEIKRGCSIWVHHELDDALVIDLLISPTAQEKHGDLSDLTIRRFDSFFDKPPVKMDWYHADRPDAKHAKYVVDITTRQIITT